MCSLDHALLFVFRRFCFIASIRIEGKPNIAAENDAITLVFNFIRVCDDIAKGANAAERALFYGRLKGLKDGDLQVPGLWFSGRGRVVCREPPHREDPCLTPRLLEGLVNETPEVLRG